MNCVFVNMGSHFGGAEKYIFSLVKKWIDTGNQAIIVARNNSVFYNKAMILFGNQIVKGVDFNLKGIIGIKSLIRESDIVNVHGVNSGVMVRLTFPNRPIITTVHSNVMMDRVEKPMVVQRLFLIAENYSLKKSCKIIVVSEAIKKYLIERNIDVSKIQTINNGVTKIEYKDFRIRQNINESLKVIYLGRLEKVKGCEYLIRAIGNLNQFDIQCDIYGAGSLEKELQNLIHDLDLDTNVKIKGFISNPRDILNLYDVIVIPSLYEAFPLTIPEAMNAKTILVCSSVGGIPWIIRNGENGYLFREKDVDELAEILTKIYENPDGQKKILETAYSEFKSKYQIDVMLNKTIDTLTLEGITK